MKNEKIREWRMAAMDEFTVDCYDPDEEGSISLDCSVLFEQLLERVKKHDVTPVLISDILHILPLLERKEKRMFLELCQLLD